MTYLVNAFSLQMLDTSAPQTLQVTPVSRDDLGDLTQYCSAVGHLDTANVLGVQMNRMNVKLTADDDLLVAQVVGGRLPEGATTLPAGTTLTFLRVKLV